MYGADDPCCLQRRDKSLRTHLTPVPVQLHVIKAVSPRYAYENPGSCYTRLALYGNGSLKGRIVSVCGAIAVVG